MKLEPFWEANDTVLSSWGDEGDLAGNALMECLWKGKS